MLGSAPIGPGLQPSLGKGRPTQFGFGDRQAQAGIARSGPSPTLAKQIERQANASRRRAVIAFVVDCEFQLGVVQRSSGRFSTCTGGDQRLLGRGRTGMSKPGGAYGIRQIVGRGERQRGTNSTNTRE